MYYLNGDFIYERCDLYPRDVEDTRAGEDEDDGITCSFYNQFDAKLLRTKLNSDEFVAVLEFNGISRFYCDHCSNDTTQKEFTNYIDKVKEETPYLNFDVVYLYINMPFYNFNKKCDDVEFVRKLINYSELEKFNESEE